MAIPKAAQIVQELLTKNMGSWAPAITARKDGSLFVTGDSGVLEAGAAFEPAGLLPMHHCPVVVHLSRMERELKLPARQRPRQAERAARAQRAG